MSNYGGNTSMAEQELNNEAVFSILLHIVLVSKDRQNVFRGEIKMKLRDVIRDICQEQRVEILEGNISSDHVHLKVSVAPKVNINKFILLLKGKTTYTLFSNFEKLRIKYHNRHLWAKSCFCCSCGEVSKEKIEGYLDSLTPVAEETVTEETPW
ncbi:MAG: IS200/IS605 family transposase [Deltaproteobacteria bacterium]|jgi:putative transposase|nr:IS200/IS605 family transposase [Deltaproteobacteria bacterium]